MFDKNLKQAVVATKSDDNAVSECSTNKREDRKNTNVWFKLFYWQIFFVYDGFLHLFVYQPTFNTIDLKEDKGTENDFDWKLKGLNISYFTLYCVRA